MHWEEGKNKGWDRKIGYTMKEYKELYTRVTELKERLKKSSKQTISALDIEKAAYVLGKEAQVRPPLKRKDEADADATLGPPPPKKWMKKTPPVSPSIR